MSLVHPIAFLPRPVKHEYDSIMLIAMMPPSVAELRGFLMAIDGLSGTRLWSYVSMNIEWKLTPRACRIPRLNVVAGATGRRPRDAEMRDRLTGTWNLWSWGGWKRVWRGLGKRTEWDRVGQGEGR